MRALIFFIILLAADCYAAGIGASPTSLEFIGEEERQLFISNPNPEDIDIRIETGCDSIQLPANVRVKAYEIKPVVVSVKEPEHCEGLLVISADDGMPVIPSVEIKAMVMPNQSSFPVHLIVFIAGAVACCALLVGLVYLYKKNKKKNE